MSEEVTDECTDDVWFAFDFDLHGLVAHVAHETVDIVARRDATHRFTKEDALNYTPNLQVSPVAHVLCASLFCASRTFDLVRTVSQLEVPGMPALGRASGRQWRRRFGSAWRRPIISVRPTRGTTIFATFGSAYAA